MKPSTPEKKTEGIRKQRLLLIAHPFPPRAQAGTFRVLRLLQFLPEFGWSTRVMTAREPESTNDFPLDPALCEWLPPDVIMETAPVWRPLERTIRWLRRRGGRTAPHRQTSRTQSPAGATRPGARVAVRCPAPRRGRWKQFLDAFRDLVFHTPDHEVGWVVPGIWRGLSMVRRHRPDVILVTSPPHSSQMIGAALALLTKIPLVIDLRDPWSRSPWQQHGNSVPQRWLNRAIESFCVRRANQVILNTERLKNEFLQFYRDLPPDRFHAVYNGYDPRLETRIQEAEAEFASAATDGVSNPVWTLCHAGSLYGRRNPEKLFIAIRQLLDQGIRLRMLNLGHVEDEVSVRQLVHEHGLDGVVDLQPVVPHHEMLQRIAECNAILILQTGTEVQVPSKLFESMLYDKPLLAVTGPGATRDIVVKYQLGLVADNSTADIAARLSELIHGPMSRPVRTGRAAALHTFHGRTLMQQLNDILRRSTQAEPTWDPLTHAEPARPCCDARPILAPQAPATDGQDLCSLSKNNDPVR